MREDSTAHLILLVETRMLSHINQAKGRRKGRDSNAISYKTIKKSQTRKKKKVPYIQRK